MTTTRYAGRPAGELVDTTSEQTPRERRLAHGVFAALRIVIGATFFWAFLDKVFGLGYATPSAKSWIHGGSPTKGFLSGSEGPFSGFYKAIAGAGWANWAFMIALAAIGTALLLGIGMRVAAVSGAVLYLMMWSVALPPAANPLLDEHVMGALAVIGLALVHAGDHFGLGRWWKSQPVVRDNAWLI